MKKRIKVTNIEINKKHCGEECPFIEELEGVCVLFGKDLYTDETGNLLRPKECLDTDGNPVVEIKVNSYNSDYCGWQCLYFNRDAEDCLDRMSPDCKLTQNALWVDNDGCRRCDFCLDGEKEYKREARDE